MPPEPLPRQHSSVVDVTEDALRCVQFSGAPYGVINANIVGPKSGPGQEDCLKLWIWKPVKANPGDNLPVMFYIHVSFQHVSRGYGDADEWVEACNSAQLRTMTLATGSARLKISLP